MTATMAGRVSWWPRHLCIDLRHRYYVINLFLVAGVDWDYF